MSPSIVLTFLPSTVGQGQEEDNTVHPLCLLPIMSPNIPHAKSLRG